MGFIFHQVSQQRLHQVAEKRGKYPCIKPLLLASQTIAAMYQLISTFNKYMPPCQTWMNGLLQLMLTHMLFLMTKPPDCFAVKTQVKARTMRLPHPPSQMFAENLQLDKLRSSSLLISQSTQTQRRFASLHSKNPQPFLLTWLGGGVDMVLESKKVDPKSFKKPLPNPVPVLAPCISPSNVAIFKEILCIVLNMVQAYIEGLSPQSNFMLSHAKKQTDNLFVPKGTGRLVGGMNATRLEKIHHFCLTTSFLQPIL